MQIRLKMMTKPGEQFVDPPPRLRHAQAGFDENGIRFAVADRAGLGRRFRCRGRGGHQTPDGGRGGHRRLTAWPRVQLTSLASKPASVMLIRVFFPRTW